MYKSRMENRELYYLIMAHGCYNNRFVEIGRFLFDKIKANLKENDTYTFLSKNSAKIGDDLIR